MVPVMFYFMLAPVNEKDGMDIIIIIINNNNNSNNTNNSHNNIFIYRLHL